MKLRNGKVPDKKFKFKFKFKNLKSLLKNFKNMEKTNAF